jgi:hypothetical protein
VLPFVSVFSTGVVTAANQWGGGTSVRNANREIIGETRTAPTAWPSVLYNQAREEHTELTYFASEIVGTASGTNLRQVVWLVTPDGSSAAALAANARRLRDSYMVNTGGWAWPAERLSRPPVTPVALANRWETGIDVQQINATTGLPSTTGNAVQIITKGHVTRFWEQQYFSPRHLMVDFLSKIEIPTSFTAEWQQPLRSLVEWYPFDRFREDRIWTARTMTGNHPRLFTEGGIISNFASLVPLMASGDTFVNPGTVLGNPRSWTPRHSASAVNIPNRGCNVTDLSAIDASIRINYGSVPLPPGPITGVWYGVGGLPTTPPGGFWNHRLTADNAEFTAALRARATALGLNITTTGNAPNVTAIPYTTPDSDVLLKAMHSANVYYNRFQVPEDGFTGRVMQIWPHHIAGGTYAVSFQPRRTVSWNAANNPTGTTVNSNHDGRLISIGHWGAHGTLHGFNERVEVEGMIDLAKRNARLFAEFAAGAYMGSHR